jgi:hypothetical protein
MKLSASLSLIALFTATLTACGGGGGGDTPPPAPAPAPTTANSGTDKYVGTWGNCRPITGAANGILSGRVDFVFNKTSETVMGGSLNYVYFKTTDCSGVVATTLTSVGTAVVTINGTKLIGTQTVDRLDFIARSATISEFNGSFKEIGLVSGNTLILSASSTLDANGYPTALDTATVFKKQ